MSAGLFWRWSGVKNFSNLQQCLRRESKDKSIFVLKSPENFDLVVLGRTEKAHFISIGWSAPIQDERRIKMIQDLGFTLNKVNPPLSSPAASLLIIVLSNFRRLVLITIAHSAGYYLYIQNISATYPMGYYIKHMLIQHKMDEIKNFYLLFKLETFSPMI